MRPKKNLVDLNYFPFSNLSVEGEGRKAPISRAGSLWVEQNLFCGVFEGSKKLIRCYLLDERSGALHWFIYNGMCNFQFTWLH